MFVKQWLFTVLVFSSNLTEACLFVYGQFLLGGFVVADLLHVNFGGRSRLTLFLLTIIYYSQVPNYRAVPNKRP